MKKVIVDASPLIFIAKADLLGVFKQIYKKAYVTTTIMNEIEWPIKHGYKALEVNKIKDANILLVEKLTAKEIIKAKRIATTQNIGKGEAEAVVLFQRGGFDNIIVADIRAQRKLKGLGVRGLDLVDLGFIAAGKRIMNPREFSKRLYEKAHYRTQRIRDILGR